MQMLRGIRLFHTPWATRKYHFKKPEFYDKNLVNAK
jgi:hypothetical protein